MGFYRQEYWSGAFSLNHLALGASWAIWHLMDAHRRKKKEYWSGLPCLVRSPALACRFFTSSATREALKIGKGGLPRWLSGKESTYQTRDGGLIHGLGRSPAEGNDKNKQREN